MFPYLRKWGNNGKENIDIFLFWYLLRLENNFLYFYILENKNKQGNKIFVFWFNRKPDLSSFFVLSSIKKKRKITIGVSVVRHLRGYWSSEDFVHVNQFY